MKIYLEEVLLLNFLLDYIILYGTKKILKRSSQNRNLIYSAFLGSMSTFLIFFKLSNLLLTIIKGVFSIGMILIAFGRKNIKENICYFYAISIGIGGFCYITNLHKLYHFRYLLLLGISLLICYFLYQEKSHYNNHVSLRYIVEIEYQKQKYKIEGYLDTGNQLTSPFKKEPVILIDFYIPSQKMIYIPFQTLNETGILPCIRPDKVKINQTEFRNCLIGLAKEKFHLQGASCILPNQWKEDLC